MKHVPTVHIVDDDSGVRKSLQMMMQTASLQVKVYESGEEFLESIQLEQPGCLVLDLRMPGLSGIEVLQQLRAAKNQIPAIIISGHADVPTAVRGMKLGAVDLLQKPFEPKDLLAAVNGALIRSVEAIQKNEELAQIRKRLEDLTPRELDLLKRLVAGMPNKRIAADLNISIKTVANHRANLMAKTKALNVADLARITMMSGVVKPE